MAGHVPWAFSPRTSSVGIHDLREPMVKVGPVRVLVEDQSHFPDAPPVLHISLALPRRAHIVVTLGKYEPPQPVLLGEVLDHASQMLPSTSGEVVRHTDIQRTVRPVRHDVHPSRQLKTSVGPRPLVDGRHKAGHERIMLAKS